MFEKTFFTTPVNMSEPPEPEFMSGTNVGVNADPQPGHRTFVGHAGLCRTAAVLIDEYLRPRYIGEARRVFVHLLDLSKSTNQFFQTSFDFRTTYAPTKGGAHHHQGSNPFDLTTLQRSCVARTHIVSVLPELFL